MHPAPKPQLNSESPREIGPGKSSRFREIVVAGLRAKQLLRGSKPRIDPDPTKRKNTTIAVEEVRRGLISFTQPALSQTYDSTTAKDAGVPIRITASEHDAFSSFNAGEGP
jgi:DNA-directed RNA polymerase omega subunit